MNFNITAYAALLLKIYTLEEQLRTHPPHDAAGLVAALDEIQGLYKEAKGMIAGADLKPADIAAIHAANQTAWADTRPAQPPPTGAFTYSAWLLTDPGDDALKNNDHVYQRGSKFFVSEGGPNQFGFAGMPTDAELLRVVTK